MTIVCILTAGMGTRLKPYTSYINKALLPINKKPAISYIISKFPKDTEFVIAIGYLGSQVKDYLTMVYPDKDIKFVEVDNYNGNKSGTGYSLKCCKNILQKPFFFVSCDTLWEDNVEVSNNNWVGVSDVVEDAENYCNFRIINKYVGSIKDKIHVSGDEYKTFTGLCYIKDYNIFWEGLRGNNSISDGLDALRRKSFIETYNIKWDDIGTLENYKKAVSRYEEYDFSKMNEFLYMDNGLVIKFFSDKNIIEKRVTKALLNPLVFPYINDKKGQFYSYQFIHGQIFYEIGSADLFKELLEWLKQNLWIKANINIGDMQKICEDFYYEKTLDRLSMYHKKYPDTDVENVINGVKVPSASELIRHVPWDSLYDGKPCFVHGDLQFDNIIYTDKKEFVLLDWRQDFGGYVEFGDLYYDLAKLYGGIILNYDYIKKKLINYSEKGMNINFDFAQRYSSSDYLDILEDFIKKNEWNEKKVRLLVPLIFLNMSPLHNYPFDKMLYALGRLMLFEELMNDK